MNEDLTAAEKLYMRFGDPHTFDTPMRSVEALLEALTCNTCKKVLEHPITLWSCEHVYCKACADVFEHCPVCSLPAWNEDHRESRAVTVILNTAISLQKLLQGFADIAQQKAETSDSAVTFPDCSQVKDTVLSKDDAVAATKAVGSLPLSTRRKPKKATQRGRRVKITPSKPFPEISDDSEETQIPDDLQNFTPVASDTISKAAETEKPNVKDPHVFATPSPPKRKRLSNRLSVTPKNSTRSRSTPLKSQRGTKTPKMARNPPQTPIRTLGQIKTPKTPKSAKKNRKGETPLHIAAIKGDMDEVEKLLEEGVDINAVDNAGWTPLHEACNHGHIEVVEQLLDAGVLVNVPGDVDETPLMDAARSGSTAIVKLLLSRGADVTLRTANGLTAPDLASNVEVKEIFDEHIFLTQSALTDFNYEKMESAPENVVLTFHFTLDMNKINSVADILMAKLTPKDALIATHYITPSYDDDKSPRQTKYLQAVARGIWIVKNDWLEACKDNGSWVSEQEFEITGSRNDLIDGGPKKSRLNRLAKRPPIFHGCHFFLAGYFRPPTLSKPFIAELLQLAGGLLLIREPRPDSDSVQSCTKVPYHAYKDTAQYFYTYYIVYDGENGAKPTRAVRRGKVCTVPLTWVLDCISQFCLCEIPDIYV